MLDPVNTLVQLSIMASDFALPVQKVKHSALPAVHMDASSRDEACRLFISPLRRHQDETASKSRPRLFLVSGWSQVEPGSLPLKNLPNLLQVGLGSDACLCKALPRNPSHIASTNHEQQCGGQATANNSGLSVQRLSLIFSRKRAVQETLQCASMPPSQKVYHTVSTLGLCSGCVFACTAGKHTPLSGDR